MNDSLDMGTCVNTHPKSESLRSDVMAEPTPFDEEEIGMPAFPELSPHPHLIEKKEEAKENGNDAETRILREQLQTFQRIPTHHRRVSLTRA